MRGVTAVRSGLELGRVKRWVARCRTSLWTLFRLLGNNLVQGAVNRGSYSTPHDSAALQQRAETVRRLRDRRGVIVLAEDRACAKV